MVLHIGLLSCFTVSAQFFWEMDTITFEDISHDSLLTIQPMPGNSWQIGTPSKTYFDTAYSVPYAICTDTLNYYTDGDSSVFDIIIKPWDAMQWNVWVPAITFVHKYDTDTLTDWSYIMYSTDNATWQNALDPLFNQLAYSGNSAGWQTVHSYMWNVYMEDSVIVRFIFQSDMTTSTKEGWMIDNIIVGADLMESIEEYGLRSIPTYPNPTTGSFTIELPPNSATLTITDLTGRIIQQSAIVNRNSEITLDLSAHPNGLYFISIATENGLYRGKVVVE